MALDDLAKDFDTYPEMGCVVIDFLTVRNQSIADVTDVFKAAFLLQDLLDPEISSGRRVTINLYERPVVALINHFVFCSD